MIFVEWDTWNDFSFADRELLLQMWTLFSVYQDSRWTWRRFVVCINCSTGEIRIKAVSAKEAHFSTHLCINSMYDRRTLGWFMTRTIGLLFNRCKTAVNRGSFHSSGEISSLCCALMSWVWWSTWRLSSIKYSSCTFLHKLSQKTRDRLHRPII